MEGSNGTHRYRTENSAARQHALVTKAIHVETIHWKYFPTKDQEIPMEKFPHVSKLNQAGTSSSPCFTHIPFRLSFLNMYY